MADPLSRRPPSDAPVQQLSLLVLTRNRTKLSDVSSGPPVVQAVDNDLGNTAAAGPSPQQGVRADRPSSAEPFPTNEPYCSPPSTPMPTMHDWKDRLVAAYATDAWLL